MSAHEDTQQIANACIMGKLHHGVSFKFRRLMYQLETEDEVGYIYFNNCPRIRDECLYLQYLMGK